MAGNTQKNDGWGNEYETVYILDASAEQNGAVEMTNRVGEVIKKMNGKLTRLDQWGRRRLAYTTDKRRRGVFVYMRYAGPSDIVAEVERNLRLMDGVFRFQTSLLKRRVKLADIQVNDTDVAFGTLEPYQEEAEPNIEQRLGMVDSPRHSRRETPSSDDSDDDSDIDGSDSEDSN